MWQPGKWWAFVLGVLLASVQSGWSAPFATFDLGTPTVTNNLATFDVSLEFPGGAGDTIEGINLSVIGSDPALTVAGTDFSRFGFTTGLANWLTTGTIGLVGAEGLIPDTGNGGLPLGPGTVSLGTLTVDLTGLPPLAAFKVTLAGGLVIFQTDAAGTLGGVFFSSFADDPTNAGVAFADPNGVTFTTLPGQTTVPEPTSLALFGVGLMSLLGFSWKRSCGLVS